MTAIQTVAMTQVLGSKGVKRDGIKTQVDVSWGYSQRFMVQITVSNGLRTVVDFWQLDTIEEATEKAEYAWDNKAQWQSALY